MHACIQIDPYRYYIYVYLYITDDDYNMYFYIYIYIYYDLVLFGGELTESLLTSASHASFVSRAFEFSARKASNFPEEVVVCPGPSDSQ